MSDSFKIKSTEGTTIDVPGGEYYFNTKARCRRMCLNSLSKEARQVHAALELGTMGFQREDAVVQVKKDVLRPMTRSDIAEMTGLEDGNVRRGLVQLETEKLAERRPIDTTLPLQKGNIQIYSWAVPQSDPKSKRESRATPKLEWVPKSWAPITSFARRCKYELPADLGDARDSLLREGEEVARELEKAEKRVRDLLERVCARARPNNEERTERTERTEDAAAASSDALDIEQETSNAPHWETEPPPPLPDSGFSNRNGNEHRNPTEAETVAQELHIDQEAAATIVHSVREVEPTATGAGIVALCRGKLGNKRNIGNQTGLLIRYIGQYAASPPGREILAAVARAANVQQTRAPDEILEPEDPVLSFEDCHHCGGRIEHLASGDTVPCKCGVSSNGGGAHVVA